MGWTSKATEAHGSIDTRVAVLVLPASSVRNWLPAGLELAPQPVVPHGWHPIYVLCSTNRFGAWFGELDYAEMMLAVPWVQLSSPLAAAPGPYIYMPRLYLDAAVPRELGVRIYGWEKRAAHIRVDEDTEGQTDYVITTKGATSPALVGRFREVEGVRPSPPAQVRNFAIVRQLFEQPTISQALHAVDASSAQSALPGPFWATTVLMRVDLPDATVQPITGSIEFGPSFSPAGLPHGPQELASLGDCELGAFRLRCQQFVSLPGPCAEHSFPRPKPDRRLAVAVLGGGPAACAAALYLARQPDRYEVSLYTTGHRLGGKCQSWRNPDKAWRAEEHGLHAFFGFYRNAFSATKEAYRCAFESPELGENLYLQALRPEPHNGLMVYRHGEWTYCPTPDFGQRTTETVQASDSAQGTLRGLTDLISGRVLDYVEALCGAAPALRRLLSLVRRAARSMGAGGLASARDVMARLVRADPKLPTYPWFLWTGVDTLLTILVGLLRHPVQSLDELDAFEFREWLIDHGLHEAPGESWETINHIYETLFAHQDGAFDGDRALDVDVRPARLACGVGIRWFLLESLSYRDAPSFRFEQSCGQTLITPFYLALRRLGAKVHFFHTVTGLVVEGEGPARRLTHVHLHKQARVSAGSAEYHPLVPAESTPAQGGCEHGRADWRMEPDWAQLEGGEELRALGTDFMNAWQAPVRAESVTLEHGRDFDLCVLGIPIGALPLIDSPLTQPDRPDADPAWRQMLRTTALTQTLSCQLWLTKPASELVANKSRGLLTCFAQPQPSFGDFTELLAHEGWREPNGPRLLAYFTGATVAGRPPLPPHGGPDYPERVQQEWAERLADWLRDHHRAFFDGPGAPSDLEQLLELLAVEDPDVTGAARLAWQHLFADVQPSSLYVLSQPGTMAARLGQAESGVRGLMLCGDWTRTDLNAGCVESAVSSGMLAARAVSNEPRVIWRPGF